MHWNLGFYWVFTNSLLTDFPVSNMRSAHEIGLTLEKNQTNISESMRNTSHSLLEIQSKGSSAQNAISRYENFLAARSDQLGKAAVLPA